MTDSTTLTHSDHGLVTGYYMVFSGFSIVLSCTVFICIHIVTLLNIGQVRTIYRPYKQTNKMHGSNMNIPQPKAIT